MGPYQGARPGRRIAAGKRWAWGVGLGLWLLGARPAEASPWTLPRGVVVATAGFDFQWADTEFLQDGALRAYPLRGQFIGSTITVDGRIGISDRLELELALPLRFVSYTSDPVILQPQPTGSLASPFDYYQDNVVDFSQSGAGVGDLSFAALYQLWARPLAVASELRLKAPTGYRGPVGTFGPEPKSVAAFTPDLVRPGKVQDDVTLGDAQLDLTLLLHAGIALPSNTFVRAAGGYKLRLGGAADQALAELRAGQGLGQRLLLYGGAEWAYSVERGRVVGLSANSVDPALPARDYQGGENIALVERRLETDWLNVGGGMIVRVAPELELNLGYQRTVWGRNLAGTNAFSVSLAFHTDTADEPEAGP